MRVNLLIISIAALFTCCINSNTDKQIDYSMNEYMNIDSIQKKITEGQELNREIKPLIVTMTHYYWGILYPTTYCIYVIRIMRVRNVLIS